MGVTGVPGRDTGSLGPFGWLQKDVLGGQMEIGKSTHHDPQGSHGHDRQSNGMWQV